MGEAAGDDMSVIESEPTTYPPMQVVVRALNVLSCLADHRQGLSLQQLHQMLGIPLGSTHRILATLEHEQFVSRLRTRRYVLGPRAHNLTAPASYQSFLVPPPAVMIEAARATGETIFLTQMIDNRVVCVSLVEARHRLRLFVKVGQEMPLNAAASARVLLAFRDPAFVEVLLAADPRQAYTTDTPREVAELIAHLADVRQRGFDVCSSELDDDVWAVSAPVFDASGRVELGISLAAAWARVEDPARRAEVARVILDAAARLSTDRGYAKPAANVPEVGELTAQFTAMNGMRARREQSRQHEW